MNPGKRRHAAAIDRLDARDSRRTCGRRYDPAAANNNRALRNHRAVADDDAGIGDDQILRREASDARQAAQQYEKRKRKWSFHGAAMLSQTSTRRDALRCYHVGVSLDERAFFTEKQETRSGKYPCPKCRRTNEYSIRWTRHSKRDRPPNGADEADRAKFAKLRDYLLRLDDEVTCKTCGKKFDIPSQHSLMFVDQLAGLPNEEDLEREIALAAGEPAGGARRPSRHCRRASRGNQAAGNRKPGGPACESSCACSRFCWRSPARRFRRHLPRGVERRASLAGITEYAYPERPARAALPRRSNPKVTVNVTYLVGSRFE